MVYFGALLCLIQPIDDLHTLPLIWQLFFSGQGIRMMLYAFWFCLYFWDCVWLSKPVFDMNTWLQISLSFRSMGNTASGFWKTFDFTVIHWLLLKCYAFFLYEFTPLWLACCFIHPVMNVDFPSFQVILDDSLNAFSIYAVNTSRWLACYKSVPFEV